MSIKAINGNMKINNSIGNNIINCQGPMTPSISMIMIFKVFYVLLNSLMYNALFNTKLVKQTEIANRKDLGCKCLSSFPYSL